MTLFEYFRTLQEQANKKNWRGFNKDVGIWVDDNSEVSKFLKAYEEFLES